MDVSDIGISEAYAALARLPERVAEGMATAVPDIGPRGKVCLCGSGEGRVACLAAKNCMDSASPCFATVVEGPVIPGWIDEGSLFVAVDFDGSSRQVRAAARAAKAAGCAVVVIAPAKGADEGEHRDPFRMPCPEAGVPGSSFGFVFGAVMKVLGRAGCMDSEAVIDAAMTPLRYFRDNLFGDSRDVVPRAARALAGCVPFVYSADPLDAAGHYWALCLSGIPGTMAFCGNHPEFNHNEISGWGSGDAAAKRLVHVALCDAGASGLVCALTCESVNDLVKMGVRTVVCRFSGANVTERILKAALLGGLVSARLDSAELRNANEPVDEEYGRQLSMDLRCRFRGSAGSEAVARVRTLGAARRTIRELLLQPLRYEAETHVS